MRLSSLPGARGLAAVLALTAGMFVATPSSAQIYAPEALQMPGSWNGYQNYPDPATAFAFRGTTTATGGSGNNAPASGGINLTPKALGGSDYQTTIHVAASGGDVTAGSYAWLFTAGNPTGGQFNNKWAGRNVIVDSLQTYSYNSGADNNVTLSNGYYTVNYVNTGYTGTSAIWMKTSAVPVSISAVSQSPVAGSVSPSDAVTVNITLSAAKSAEEKVYIRWSTNSFSTSKVILATGSGTSYSATIPAQVDGTIVSYYAFTSTLGLSNLNSGYDAKTLRFKNAGGTSAFTYTSTALPPVNITFSVDMTNAPVSGGVFIAGSFNGFSTTANPLTQVGSTNVYSTTISIAQGAAIQYKFLNGTNYESNISAPCGNGSNRTYTVGSADDAIATTCFSVCGACPPQHAVTFQVDMQNEGSVSSMNLSGTFNGYNTSATPMTQIGSTGVWTATINLVEGNSYNYKFVKNGGSYENNIPSGTCNPGGAGGNDRRITVGTSNMTVPLTCFSSCGACTPIRNITFQVDMRDQAVTGPVTINGSFVGWSSPVTMTNTSGTIYSVTIPMAVGSSIEYKFINNGSYEGNISAPCGNGSNRTYTVPSAATTLSAVCFGSCTACPPQVPVTFSVNMSEQTVGGNGVHVLGNFNGYSPSATALTSVGGGVYQATVNVPANATLVYRYVNGNSYAGAEVGSSVCGTSDGFGNFNRNKAIGSSSVTLGTVCFDRCENCTATNTWTGAVSTDYSNGANWSSGRSLTGCTYNAQISAAARQPSIPASSTLALGNLTINQGATLTVDASSSLSVCGNLSVAGQLSGGTLLVNGSGSQSLSGNVSVNDLTITKSTGTTTVSGGAVRVNKNLTLSNSTSSLAISGGQLILSSNASGTARLNPVPAGATITGNLTLERYLGAASAWHFVGSPFSSATQLSDYNEIGVRISPKNNSNIFEYTEADTTRGSYNGYLTESKGWKVPAALTNSINPTNAPKGYRVYAAGGRTLSVSGSPFIGDKSASFTFSPTTGWDGGGWNLLANPYASEIDWNAFRFDGSNTGAAISNAVTIWNAGSSNYGTYTALNASTGIGTGISSQYIASSQGFFVKASGAGSVTFKEAHKSNANATSFLRDGQLPNMLKMKVAQGNDWDETALLFYPGGAVGRDQFDADNLGGSAVDVSTKPTSGLNLAINIMPELNARYEVPVSFTTAGTGRTTLSFTGLETFDSNYGVYLRDNFLGTLTDLNSTSTLDIQVTSNPASSGSSRFTLVFSPNSVTGIHETIAKTATMSIWPNPASANAKLNVSLNHFGGNTATVMLTDVTGKVVRMQSVSLSGDATASFDISALPAGVYTLKAQGVAQTLQDRVVVR